jgi:amino acid permease
MMLELRMLVGWDAAAYAPLPFAVAHLGWVAGVFFLALAGLVTWYTSLLLASLDRHDGHRHVRYCDLAHSIYGALVSLI